MGSTRFGAGVGQFPGRQRRVEGGCSSPPCIRAPHAGGGLPLLSHLHSLRYFSVVTRAPPTYPASRTLPYSPLQIGATYSTKLNDEWDARYLSTAKSILPSFTMLCKNAKLLLRTPLYHPGTHSFPTLASASGYYVMKFACLWVTV
jgi:hypothetical protein